MRRTRAAAVAGLCLAAGWAAGTWRGGWREGGDGSSYHTGPTIERVQALSSLVTARVDVADVVESRLDGRLGGAKAALLVKGDFLLGVDLSLARFEAVDAAARTAVLVLPQPKVTSPRLDHSRSRVFAVTESGLWQVAPGGGDASAAVVNKAYRDAQRFVAAACDDPSLMPRARQQAERVLAAFFRATDWKVTVRWAD